MHTNDLSEFDGLNETTAAGDSPSALFNSTGGYTITGIVTDKIIMSDLVLWSGSVHIIGLVFLNEVIVLLLRVMRKYL